MARIWVRKSISILRAEAEEPARQALTAHDGVLSSVFLMLGLPFDTWLRFGIWLVVGLFVYALYGVRHSQLQRSG